MSYYKRNRRGGGRGKRPSEPPLASQPVQILRGQDFSLRKEMDYILQAASRGEGRIVTVGALVFFSTSDGDAWVLDVEDNLALCLMGEFERCDTDFQESAETFSIRWDSTFAIEQGCFLVTGQPAIVEASTQSPAVLRMRTVAYPNYPVPELQRAIQQAKEAAKFL